MEQCTTFIINDCYKYDRSLIEPKDCRFKRLSQEQMLQSSNNSDQNIVVNGCFLDLVEKCHLLLSRLNKLLQLFK